MTHIGIEFVSFIYGKKISYAFVLVFNTGILLKKTFLNNTRILLNGEDRDKLALRFTVFYKLSMIFYELQPAFLHFAMDLSDSI